MPLDWKFPLAVSTIYISLCLLYDTFFNVPGSISWQALFVYSLPYFGSALALYSSRNIRRIFLDTEKCSDNKNSNIFFQKVTAISVSLSFILQLISWSYIFNKVDSINSLKEFFMYLREASLELLNIVPPVLTYPNGLCFAAFCLAFSGYRVRRKIRSLFFLSVSILNVFLNDLQTSGRAGMAFVVFILLATAVWDWRVNGRNPFGFLISIFGISIFTQLPKVLRSGYQPLEQKFVLFDQVMRYCFSYLNTLTELLTRLPEPNWIGQRTFLPIYNLASRINPNILRSAIHNVERSNIWGYNNYTISGEILRDFSYIGCLLIPFLITLLMVYFASISSRPINITITLFYSGWLVYGAITNIFMMGGFFFSIVFIFALASLDHSLFRKPL